MYLVNAPSSIHANSDFNVSLTLLEGDKPTTFKTKIAGPDLEIKQEVIVLPKNTEVITLKIPEIHEGKYNITFEGTEGIRFKSSKTLRCEKKKRFFVFIQTDKATYKPGDLVRFRVLFLDDNTRPARLDHPIHLQIVDGDQNLLKHSKNIMIKNGVYSDSYQLTEFANIGKWKLHVTEGNKSLENKYFEVAKYVLPKFDAKIVSPSDIWINDKTLKVQVCSNYTYGKPVTGKAVVTVTTCQSFNRHKLAKTYCEKTMDIIGKSFIEFDMINDLNYTRIPDQFYSPSLKVTATVEEELTGLKQEVTQQINVHLKRFTVSCFEIPKHFHPEKDCVVKVAVKKYDGTPITDSKDPVILLAESTCFESYPYATVLEFEGHLDKNGIATFTTKLNNIANTLTAYNLKARYHNIESYIGHISQYVEKSGEYLDLEVETENPVIDEDVVISLKSNKALGSFIYHVVKRDDILKTERVDLGANETCHSFQLKPSFSMIPSVKIVVFIYRNGDLKKKELLVKFKKELKNKVELEVCEESEPGKEVNLTVKTQENSFVGLLGVDQSVLVLKQGNNLEVGNILDQIEGNMNGGFRFGCFPPSNSSIITVTNANFEEERMMQSFAACPGASMSASPLLFGGPARNRLLLSYSTSSSFAIKAEELVQIRKEFPETWIWEDIEITDSKTTIKRVVPDTMTSWVLTAFALNDDIGLGITKEPTKLKVFQPFFVSMNLPYAIKRGEVISIPVTIFNYMENEVSTDVSLENQDDEFDFVEGETTTKSINVLPDVGQNVFFKIKAKKVGQITLKVKAISPLAGDIIHQMLRVEPEGVTEYVNKALLINLADKKEQREKIDIEIPMEAVQDSQNVELSLVGDILGPTIKNLDQLVRVPYGCGEQNMVNFVPNILVLRYLEATKQLNETIQRKAKKFLEIGYERQLSYKHMDGSYSAFGVSPKGHGSTWLTAYVARSFHQAKLYTFIDDSIIEAALDFLVSKQEENGSFKEDGKLFDHRHASAEHKGFALTAFVLLAFLENKKSISKYNDCITKGLKFLSENIDTINDLYTESISAYALSLAKHEKRGQALELLNNKATKASDKKFWVLPKKEEEVKPKSWCWRPQTHDVEVTSYAFLSFADQQTIEEMLPTIKWLISQRNSKGGFSSTQDTVVGLQALTKFAENIGGGNAEMDIDFKDDKGSSGSFNISKDNSLVLQSHVLSNDTKSVDVTAKGKGSCLLQISYKFNLDNKDERPSFTLKPSVKERQGDVLILAVVVNYLGDESNMAVLEVSLPSGYIADKDEIEKIISVKRVQKVETKNDNTVIVIYFDSLSKEDVNIDVCALRTHQVEELKKSAVLIYDYYDNSKVAKEFYEL